MIFEAVTLNNLGAFKGLHSLNLSIEDKSKPLVLIGGMNGAGKTTLLTAIQLALYGKLCDEASSFSNYNSFLKEIINDSAMDNEEDFSVSLDIQFDGFPITGSLCIKRSWSKQSKGYKEQFSVSSDEIDVLSDEVKDIQDNWIEIMQRILSPELSDLFFFDGEKIIKLADEKTSAELFRESISTLLGLDLVSRLNNDIKSITSAIGVSQDSELAKELIVKEEEEKLIKKDIESLETKIKKLDTQIEKNESKITAIEEEFQLQSGSGFSNHQLKKDETTLISSQMEGATSSLLTLMAGCLPLALIEKRISNLHSEVKNDVARREAKSTLQIFKDREAKILSWLDEASLTKESLKLSKELKKWNANLEKQAVGETGFSDHDTTLNSLTNLLDDSLPNALENARELKEQIRTLGNRLQKLKSDIQKLPDESEIKRIQIELSGFEAKQETFNSERSRLEEELKSRNFVLDRNESSIRITKEGILASDIAVEDDKRILKHLLQSQDVLSKFEKTLTEKNVNKLETEITKSFKKLLRKKNLFHSCKIDSQNMSLTLLNSKNKVVNPARLSAGERQILAVSILWAISKSVEHSLPIIIDTPLGRLDSEHRGNVIFDYFPKASDQVILLSTDEEITSKHSKELENVISHQFMVEADEKKGTSIFRAGYF